MGKIRLPGQMLCRVFHFGKMYSFITRIKTSEAGERTGLKLKFNLKQFSPLCQSCTPQKEWMEARKTESVRVCDRERGRERVSE